MTLEEILKSLKKGEIRQYETVDDCHRVIKVFRFDDETYTVYLDDNFSRAVYRVGSIENVLKQINDRFFEHWTEFDYEIFKDRSELKAENAKLEKENAKLKKAEEQLKLYKSKLGAEEIKMTMEENIRISKIEFEPEYGKYILRINGWCMGEFETKDEAEKALAKYRKFFGEMGIIIV